MPPWESVDLAGDVKKLVVDGQTVEARTVILAMGAKPRPLGLPREAELTGKGVSYCATCDGAFFKGKQVAVVGGGDTAISDALYLAPVCGAGVRRAPARRAARGQIAPAGGVCRGEDRVCVPQRRGGARGRGEGRGADGQGRPDRRAAHAAGFGVFAAVGIVPESGLVRGQVACTEDGRIRTNEFMETDVPGVYAAGDIRTTPLRQGDHRLRGRRGGRHARAGILQRTGLNGPAAETEKRGSKQLWRDFSVPTACAACQPRPGLHACI